MTKKVLKKQFNIDFGGIIRERRNQLRLSIEKIADDTGISKNMVQAIEVGRVCPSVEKAARVCDALGLDLGWVARTAMGKLGEEKWKQ